MPIRKTASPLKTKAPQKTTTPQKKSPQIHGFIRGSTVLKKATLLPATLTPAASGKIDGECHIFGGSGSDYIKTETLVLKGATDVWQNTLVMNRASDSLTLQTRRGPVWILRPKLVEDGQKSVRKKPRKIHHQGLLDQSPYTSMRERMGNLWSTLRDVEGVKHLGIFFHGCAESEILGALAGIEMASYRFTYLAKSRTLSPPFKVTIHGASSKVMAEANHIGESVNLARHLVNLDAAKLNPKTYSDFVSHWFKGSKTMSVEVWGPARVLKEKSNLHYGVGQGAVERSHMVHLKYRPKGKNRLEKPIAFVGKGVTFDTGGLDLKPASGMRFMKKDMGGSASVVGIAHWLVESQSDVACDLYLALAENAVDKESFRPGDVLTARNGMTVEIHNTDAEGRLVMADVMDVAQGATAAQAPMALIDLSTLTGAMRVAVGAEISGMFANHDGLADLALKSGAVMGDPAWRLPLWDNYKTQLRSSFADLANASDSGLGGAISAALFLQKFVRGQLPWMHFDFSAWNDRPMGGCAEVGGNGQTVQMMIYLLKNITSRTFN